MIAQGYVVVRADREGSREYFLEERLALEAAKEFFFTEIPKSLEKTLGKLLASQVTNPSGFGKTAEWFLAWVSYLRLQRWRMLIFV
jgi:hypothetical protein